MIKINAKEDTSLNFEVDISGSTATPQPRLIVQIAEDVWMSFTGKLNEGNVEVDIADLMPYVESNTFNAKLEVIVEDSIFTPWEDTIEITKPAEVKAKSVATESKKTEISAKPTVSSKSSSEPEPVVEDKDPTEEKSGRKVIGEFKPKKPSEIFNEKL